MGNWNLRRTLAVGLALLLAAPTAGLTVASAAAPAPPSAPGPVPNGTLPNGSLPNGTLPNGTLPNGTLPNGTLPNGTLPNGTLPNGTLPNGTRPNGTLPGRDVPHFTDATDLANIGHQSLSRVAWGDYDGDGFDDLMFNGGVLYRNNRDGTFSDASFIAGTRGGFSGGVWGDYNNDGLLDYYATAWAPTWDTLFRNNGDGSFTNVTALAGNVYDNLPSEAAAWADYDLDGCLDLYVANYEWPPLDANTASYGTPNILWHNDCDGTFTNATAAAGMTEDLRSRGVVWGDINNDRYPDLYVSNYRLEPNELWVNQKNGTFLNEAPSLGVDCDNLSVIPNPAGVCGHSIGADFADFNNDGNEDLYVANLAHPMNLAAGDDTSQMYENRGGPNYNFVNIREAAGILYCETASNPTFGDFDADGRQDLFVTSIYENRTANLYQNKAPASGSTVIRMDDVTTQAGVGLDNGWGAAWSDYDRDGDLDLVVGRSTGATLYRNDGNNASWVEIELVGRNSNKAGIGALVEVSASMASDPNTPWRYQRVQGGDGTGSQSTMHLFFGNPEATAQVRVRVHWPSGINQNLTLDTRAYHVIQEPEGIIDVAVTDFTATPASPVAGQQVVLTAQVTNVGTAPPQSGSLVFYHDSASPSNQIARKTFSAFTGTLNLSAPYYAPASTGSVTVIARLEDVTPQDQDSNNDGRTLTLSVRNANTPPVANLTASPVPSVVGDPVHFDGSRSVDDSGILQYIFDFGDQSSSLQDTATADHIFAQPGTYMARLTVVDDNGEPSTNDASASVLVRPPGAAAPTAIIDAVTPPSPEMLKAPVTFDGHGEATEGLITRYEWTSDLDGELSTQGTFQTDTLALGKHTISFRVQDSNGLWSDPATTQFRVVSSGNVSITFLNIVDGFNVRGTTLINGTATAFPGVSVTRLQWRVDNGSSVLAAGTSAFSFTLDPTTYTKGPHDITVTATDSDGLLTARTLHVMFADPATTPFFVSPFVLAGGASLLAAIALALVVRGRRKRSKLRASTPANLRKLPFVAPPGPIRPLPVPPRGPPTRPGAPRPGGPLPPGAAPRAKVRVKARAIATNTPTLPPAPPPANP